MAWFMLVLAFDHCSGSIPSHMDDVLASPARPSTAPSGTLASRSEIPPPVMQDVDLSAPPIRIVTMHGDDVRGCALCLFKCLLIAQQTKINFEYLKNVMLKYMSSKSSEVDVVALTFMPRSLSRRQNIY